MRRIILGFLVMSAGLAGGCVGTGGYYYGVDGTFTATVAPDLFYVAPGVQVVADYDYPVFYADNYYWRYDNGLWYRSNWYTGGWAYATPPYAVSRIERPYEYRRYRPSGYVSRRTHAYDHRGYPGYYRGYPGYYRGYGYPGYRSYPGYRAPVHHDTRSIYRDTRVHSHRQSPGYHAPSHRHSPGYHAPAHRGARPFYRTPAPTTRGYGTSRPPPRSPPAAHGGHRSPPAAHGHRPR
jgi:hypothetical protein